MRLWSISPYLLPAQHLNAAWREGLLAKKVLEGNTKGYKNHPQLDRFKESVDPEYYINLYLLSILKVALHRGYKYNDKLINIKKIKERPTKNPMVSLLISKGQLIYELELLFYKYKNNPIILREAKKFYDKHGLINNHVFQERSHDKSIENWEKPIKEIYDKLLENNTIDK